MQRDPALREDRSQIDRLFPLSVYHANPGKQYIVLHEHWHEDIEILGIREGRAVFQVGHRHFYTEPGDILIVPGGELHSGYGLHQSHHRHDAVVFSPSLLRTGGADAAEVRFLDPLFRGRFSLPCYLRGGTEPGIRAGRALEGLIESYERRRPGYELAVRGHLFVFLAAAVEAAGGEEARSARREQEQTAWFKKVLDYVEAECHRPLRLEEIARVAMVSPCHLCRLFHRLSGRTLTEHINLIRVQRARRLLVETDRKILDIATECGFSNINHFINTYKRYCRERPSETRRGQGG